MPLPKHGFTVDQLIQEGRVTKENIDNVRLLLAAEKQKLPELTDEQVALFLIVGSNDLEKAKKTVLEYFTVRNSSPAIFDGRSFVNSQILEATQVAFFGLLPERTNQGDAVLYGALNASNQKSFHLGPVLKLLCMAIDTSIYDNPPTGLTVLFDMTGFGLMHIMKLMKGVSMLSAFFRYIQEGMHVKLNKVHVLNAASYVDKLMFIIKPFMKPELVQSLHFHPPQMDMESFFSNHIPKRCVPKEHEGLAPKFTSLHEDTIQKLKEMQQYFMDEEEQRHSV